MIRILRQTPAVGASLLFHVGLLAAFAAIKFQLLDEKPLVAIQTIFVESRDEERPLEQVISIDNTPSANVSMLTGGVVSTNVAASTEPAVQQTRIDKSNSLQDPKVLNVSLVDVASDNLLGEAVGEGEINGEVGARAPGYGAALSRISAEIMRMMREQPVLVVWLFDASGSLADDREEIADEFHRIYEELSIARDEANASRLNFESLETMVCMFGERVTPLMREPTGDVKQVREAIGRIQQDEAGKENVFSGVISVLDQYAEACLKTKRKLAVVVVSDESGDDGSLVEDAIIKARDARAPVYFLGRESIFGYPYASVRVRDEETGIYVWPTISRGPETAMPEMLQWNGFGKRHGRNSENSSAGFGPYEQSRLARESGGIFFLLADLEENLAGENTQRQYDVLAMKEYKPLLLPRVEYIAQRDASRFRTTIWDIVTTLNPNTESGLNFGWIFPGTKEEFQRDAKREFDKAAKAIVVLNAAIAGLEKAKPLRAEESSSRWRAAYDLIYAQCLTYKVRLFQYCLSLDYRATEWPAFKNEKTNRLIRTHTQKLREPTERQLKATGVTSEEIERARKDAVAAFNRVISEHPGTPWALRADVEKRRAFGSGFREHFHNPQPRDPTKPNPRPKVPKL